MQNAIIVIIVKIQAEINNYSNVLESSYKTYMSVFNQALFGDITNLPVGEVTRIVSCNTFRTPNSLVKLEGVLSLDPKTPQNGMVTERLKRLILGKRVSYKTKYRDEYGRLVAQVWTNNANVNIIMKEYIRSLPQSPFSVPITRHKNS
jgi:NADPH-dependent 7-cyano-7-deazaguanine reductase QueF-like protein